MEKALLTLILVLCSAVSFSADLTWQLNSNWEVNLNWKLGRQPCAGDTVRFEQSSRPSIVYLNSKVTVRRLLLSSNSKLILGRNSVIRFSNATECDSRSTVVAKAGDNVFIGARDSLWECPENWRTSDDKVPKTAPCGADRAVFPKDSAFSFVTTNSSKQLNVAAVQLREKTVTDFKNFSREFPSLGVTIRPECVNNAVLCGCPEVPKACVRPSVAPPKTGSLGQSNSGGIIAGVVIVVIVVVIIVILVVVAVVWWMKSGRSASFHPYHKETLDEPTVMFSKDEEAAVNFDNPMFDTTSDFDDLVGAEEVPEPTVPSKGGGDECGGDLPEKKPL